MPGPGSPRVAVDGIVPYRDGVVAVVRRNEPFRGLAALPGGFVELGEPAEAAVVREVREETGLETKVVRLVGVYSDPARDPRGHVISVVYELEPIGGDLRADSDAQDVIVMDPEDLPRLAFDHARILEDWRGR